MQFDLMKSHSTFQSMMNQVANGLYFVKVYHDDVDVFSNNFRKHAEHIQIVVDIVAAQALKVKVAKFAFSKKSVTLFGHFADRKGVRVDLSKVDVMRRTPRPTSLT